MRTNDEGIEMRTTLDVDPKLLSDILELTGEKIKSKAVSKALKRYLRSKSITELRGMAGKIQIDDVKEEQEEADRRRELLLEGLRGS